VQAAHEAAGDCERLLARAAAQLLTSFADDTQRVLDFPRELVIVNRAVEIARLDEIDPYAVLVVNGKVQIVPLSEAESDAVAPEIARVANAATRASRNAFRTLALSVRLNVHRTLRELDQAIEAAPPGEDRDHANTIATELLQLAERLGLADDLPLERVWPRLVARLVQIERHRHHAARAS
jgi:hypothetical protein